MYGWFFELCEKIEKIVKEAVEEFCKENNFKLNDLYCEYRQYYTHICHIELSKKLEKTTCNFTLHLVTDLDIDRNMATVDLLGNITTIKHKISRRQTCKKLNVLKQNIKNAIKSFADMYINRCIYEDKKQLFLDELRKVVGRAGRVERFSDHFYITIGEDKIIVDIKIEKGEVMISDIEVRFNANLKKILFLDVIVNTYGWKHLIRYVGKTTVILDLLYSSKEEQMNVLDKVIELVKMYNLFT